MAPANYEPVVFQNSRGETISNDPIYKAKQTLATAGVEDATQPTEQPKKTVNTGGQDTDPDGLAIDPDELIGDDETPTGDSDDRDRYDSMNGAELKAEAKERGVDISGLSKVGQVREALRTADDTE